MLMQNCNTNNDIQQTHQRLTNFKDVRDILKQLIGTIMRKVQKFFAPQLTQGFIQCPQLQTGESLRCKYQQLRTNTTTKVDTIEVHSNTLTASHNGNDLSIMKEVKEANELVNKANSFLYSERNFGYKVNLFRANVRLGTRALSTGPLKTIYTIRQNTMKDVDTDFRALAESKKKTSDLESVTPLSKETSG
jgi:hypothetical protein